jgi:hypothetical protein
MYSLVTALKKAPPANKPIGHHKERFPNIAQTKVTTTPNVAIIQTQPKTPPKSSCDIASVGGSIFTSLLCANSLFLCIIENSPDEIPIKSFLPRSLILKSVA